MGERKALRGSGASSNNTITPRYAPIPEWGVLSGLGRTKTYELLGDGTLRAIKVGARLLIDVEHGLAVLAAMPAAQIRAKSKPLPKAS